jgi:hypothetical protein
VGYEKIRFEGRAKDGKYGLSLNNGRHLG